MQSLCPHCLSDLTDSWTEADGNVIQGTKMIGVNVRGIYDGVLFWQCPFCSGRWHRWQPDSPYRAKADIYVKSDRVDNL